MERFPKAIIYSRDKLLKMVQYFLAHSV